jgi:hypothetical protein
MDTNMPQLKQPMRLEEACIRLQINKYCGKCELWVGELIKASTRGTRAFRMVSNSVINQCREVEEDISKLKIEVSNLLSPRLAKTFVKLIRPYDSDFFTRHPINASVWKAMFRSVLTRFVERFDKTLVTNNNVSAIMVQNLDSVPG